MYFPWLTVIFFNSLLYWRKHKSYLYHLLVECRFYVLSAKRNERLVSDPTSAVCAMNLLCKEHTNKAIVLVGWECVITERRNRVWPCSVCAAGKQTKNNFVLCLSTDSSFPFKPYLIQSYNNWNGINRQLIIVIIWKRVRAKVHFKSVKAILKSSGIFKTVFF